MATLQSVRDQARAAVAEGDYQRALSLIALIHRHFPSDLEAVRLLGQIHVACGRRAEARESFDRVLEVDPESVVARSGLALLAEEEGDPDGALEQFERAFDLDSSNSQVAAEIGRLHSLSSHTRPVDPGSTQHAMARRFLQEKRYARAVALFEEALRQTPERLEVVVGLAQALWLSGGWEEAERVAAGVVVSHPDCLRMLAILAGASFSRGEGETLFLLRRTDEFDPGNSVARRLFLDAGLPFPRVGVDPDIPKAELQMVPAPVARVQTLAPEDLEEDWEEEAEVEPFTLPEVELDGEWVRGKGPFLPMADRAVLARWLKGDSLAAAGQFLQAMEQYLVVLHGLRQTSPSDRRGSGEKRLTVEKEQDGTDSGNREA